MSAFREPERSHEPRKASTWPWPALVDKILLSFCPHKADRRIQENKLKTGEMMKKAEAAKVSDTKDNNHCS